MSPEAVLSSVKVPLMVLLAVLNLQYVIIQSSVRYLLYGSRAASWNYSTNIARDLIYYIANQNGRASGGLLYKASSIYWQKFSSWPRIFGINTGYPSITTTIDIPSYPISGAVLQASWHWAEKLGNMSAEAVSSNKTLYAECIAAKNSQVDNIFDTGTACGPTNNHEMAILYFHGGGYVSCTLDTYRKLRTRLAAVSGLPVYAVEYGLAPQFKYPSQLYDAYCAFRYMLTNLGFSSRNIIIAGDSAGGNLALGLWQLIRNETPPRALLLLSPRVDISYTRESWHTNADVDYLQPEAALDPNSSIYKLLVSSNTTSVVVDDIQREIQSLVLDPYLAPVHANLSNLPPTLIQVGKSETMFSDIHEFSKRAISSVQQNKGEGPVVFQVFSGAFHVFQISPFTIPELDDAWDKIGAFIQSLQTR
ncbi:Alpha/Beta hydrolase protein [Coemansia spiralis]|nr:Alpha/Beta hydrolase protein [Coemansia spiralis]